MLPKCHASATRLSQSYSIMPRLMHHYEASLARDLTRLREKIREMAQRNAQSLRDGLAALLANDRQLAYQ